MIIANYIALIILMIGGLNWGLIGLINFNLVAWLSMGNKTIERIIYILVLIATLYLIVASIIDGGILLSEIANKPAV